jgi:hypothetical protein
MMIKMNRLNAILILTLFSLLSTGTFAQRKSQNQLIITSDSVSAQDSDNELSILSLAYGKLAKFIHAGNLRAATFGQKTRLTKEYEIRFEVWDIRTGPIEEIYNVPYGNMVTKPSGDSLQIITGQVRLNDEPEKVIYEAKWAIESYADSPNEDWEKVTVKEVLEKTGNALAPTQKYTAYQVKVNFMEKERSYRAMIIYHSDFQPSKAPRVLFLDNITGMIPLTKAFSETRSAVD